MIPVTKPYLPSRKALDRYIDGIYQRECLTNNGPLVKELTRRLKEYLGVEHLLLVNNGTLALQIAYRALGITGHEQPIETITTPFTFVATASSLKWEGIEPIFVDIDSASWCLNPELIEATITTRTRAIVPVHVFGNASEVGAIDAVARQHGLKVVYDASHAFGVTYNQESLLRRGDAATLSFHATKLFHTLEGGAIVFKREEDLEYARKLINFGITGPESIEALGVNAKMNEFQAAVGLCVLDELKHNLAGRERVWNAYMKAFGNRFTYQQRHPQIDNNYAYFPVLLNSESELKTLMAQLKAQDIHPRRYFYPSLDTLAMFPHQHCPVSRDIAQRILCLPMYESVPSSVVINALMTQGA